MAEKFTMGLAGALSGMGRAVAEVGREKTEERGVAYDLYIRLSQNPRYKKTEGFEYTRGMTRIQVMQGFEEDPDYTLGYGASGAKALTQKQIDRMATSPGFKWMEGAKEGDITVDMMRAQTQARGQTLGRRSAIDRMAMAALENEAKRALQDKKTRQSFLLKLADMHPDDLQQWLGDPVLGPITKKLFEMADFKIEPRYDKLRQTIANILGPTRLIAPQPFKATPTEGTVPPPAVKTQRPSDDVLISIIKQAGSVKNAKNILSSQYGMSGAEIESFIRKYAREISAGAEQLAPPGGAPPGLIEDLRRPSPTGVGAGAETGAGTAPSTFMPNASPYNRLKTLAYLRNIPRQRQISTGM